MTPAASSHALPFFRWRFWPLQCIGWLGVALFTFPIKLYFLGSWQAVITATVLREGVGFLLTVGMRLIYRGVAARRPMKGHLLFYAMLVAVVSLLASAVDTAHIIFMEYSLHSPYMEKRAFLAGTFCYRSGLFCFWSIFYFGIKMMQESHAHEIAWRDAEIRVLRAQINPHFFFNALNTIGVEKNMAALSALIQHLAAYLRYSLRFRSQSRIELAQEYEAAVNYLAIEKARFRDQLEIDTHLDANAAPLLVPGIILQPLLENAIKHGRRTSPLPLKVSLSIALSNGAVEINVRNTGHWVASGQGAPESGVGLENLRQRLALLHPGCASLQTGESNGHVHVQVRVPAFAPTASAHAHAHAP